MGFQARIVKPTSSDLLSFLRHVKSLGFLPRTVFDVGVADGTIELYSTFPDARHILVEPIEEFKPALEFLCARYNAEYILAGASDEDGTADIFFSADLHGASILEGIDDPETSKVVSRQIRTARLDTLTRERETEGPYLLKVDTQGSELRVLDGAEMTLRETEVVVLEVSLFRFQKGGPIIGDVVAYMKEKGFVVFDIFGGHARPLDGALAQVDMAFVKEDGAFRASHEFATEEQFEAQSRSLLNRLRRLMNI